MVNVNGNKITIKFCFWKSVTISYFCYRIIQLKQKKGKVFDKTLKVKFASDLQFINRGLWTLQIARRGINFSLM